MTLRVIAGLMSVSMLVVVGGAGCSRHRSPDATTASETTGAPPPAVPQAARPAESGKTVIVFAGAASKPALAELGAKYEAETGVKVSITFGGSGAVLTQFSQEQYGDVYVPGSDDFMGKAEKKDAVLSGRTVLVYLVPAICVAKGNPKNVRELKDLARSDVRVVLGQPKSVCLGDIAESILVETGLADKVKPRVASYASSCEEVLNQLVLGEADVVIGWDVFARQQPGKVEMIPLPKELARPRNIPASVIKWSKQPEEAKAFIKYLTSAEAQGVFSKHGYTVTPPS